MKIDPGTLILIAAGCGLTCLVLFVLGTVLNALGFVFELAGNIIELAVNLFNLGPLPGCGCLAIVLAVVTCIGGGLVLSNIISTCDTASRMAFCSWIGR